MTVSETLRDTIETCGMTRAEIARGADVTESALSRFVVSGKGLGSGNLDALCAFLGLELKRTKKPGKSRKGK